jgi:hypothetical protein
MNDFIFRLVQWGDSPPQINVVCKRCLWMSSFSNVFDLFTQAIRKHDCKDAKVSNFTGIPEKL